MHIYVYMYKERDNVCKYNSGVKRNHIRNRQSTEEEINRLASRRKEEKKLVMNFDSFCLFSQTTTTKTIIEYFGRD